MMHSIQEQNFSTWRAHRNNVLWVICPENLTSENFVKNLSVEYGEVIISMTDIIEQRLSQVTEDAYAVKMYDGFIGRAIADLRNKQIIVYGATVALLESVQLSNDTSVIILNPADIKPSVKELVAENGSQKMWQSLVIEKPLDYLMSCFSLQRFIGLENMDDRSIIEQYMETLSDKVNENVQIVTPKEVGQDFFLHVSTDNDIKEFIPMIGERQNHLEDRTVARVCVGVTIMDCVLGHNGVYWAFMNEASTGGRHDNYYKGGFEIYSIPFEYALKPNDKMVPVAHTTNEHWLIAYSPDTVEYVPQSAGKFFIRSIAFIGLDKSSPVMDPTLYVEISKESGVLFSKDLKLEKGYYIISGVTDLTTKMMHWTAKDCSKEEYVKAKFETASMLSIDQPPSYLGW